MLFLSLFQDQSASAEIYDTSHLFFDFFLLHIFTESISDVWSQPEASSSQSYTHTIRTGYFSTFSITTSRQQRLCLSVT